MRFFECNLFIIILFAAANGASGGVFTYPVLESEGNCIENLVPDRWSVFDSAQGDLNGDSLADIAVVFEFEDSAQFISNDEYYPDTSFYKPRVLAIYFRDSTNGRYTFSERSNSFIISSTHKNMVEPYEGMRIQDGALTLDFISMWSMGSWWMSRAEYTFRYRQGQFHLVSCEYANIHRGSLESTLYSIDFLKEEYSVTRTEFVDDDFIETFELKKITYPEIQSLRSLIKPFFWEFEEGIII
ncbi:hypothetical protein JW890_00655 [candidate division WOR-3 bacterium]|nr:hypothetical protein [candidate division WOR-3 bacterium]